MTPELRCIIGLGNPGSQHTHQRHNIGFRVVDELCDKYQSSWHTSNSAATAEIMIDGKKILIAKPLTGMNLSGHIVSLLRKKGIAPENTIIVHDELELPFGKVALKRGGSARGHNGLRSFIAAWGDDFYRLRCGISRPVSKDAVPTYVLSSFSESGQDIDAFITSAVDELSTLIAHHELSTDTH
jgi:PTH1 family peptidyl-tRNA hydrolase